MNFDKKNNKDLITIANLYHKLECLNISSYTKLSEILIYNIIYSCPKFQHFNLNFCEITDITIKAIASSCLN